MERRSPQPCERTTPAATRSGKPRAHPRRALARVTPRTCVALAAAAIAAFCALAAPLVAQAPHSVVLWHAYGEREARGLRAAVDAWEAAHPEARVDVVPVPFGAYATKLSSAIPTGNGPDLFIDAHDRLPSYVTDRLVARLEALDDAALADAEPAHLSALTVEGALYGVPVQIKSAALFVNDGLAREHPFETLEDLEATAASLPEGTVALAWEPQSSYAAAALFHAYGAAYLDEAGAFGAESDAGARALAHLLRLESSGTVPTEASGDLVRDLFRSGRALAAVSGPWLAPDLPAELAWSIRPLPAVRDAAGRAMEPFATVEAAMIAERAREPERARDLAAFLSGPTGSVLRAREGGHVVTSRAAWLDPALAADARLRAFRDAADHARPMPTHSLVRSVFGPMDRAIRRVLRGDSAPAEALSEAHHRFDDETRPAPEVRSPTLGLVVLGSALALVLLGLVRRTMDPSFRAALARSRTAYAWVAHAVLAVGLLVVCPLLVGAATSFFAGRGSDLHYVGVANYVDILTARGGDLLGHGSFYVVLGVTVLWTVVNVVLHLGIGLFCALILHRPAMKLRGVYRVLLVLPWAVPSYVTALAWRGMFHRQLGAVNAVLEALGAEPVSWFAQFSTAFTANVATNVWLGFPFMMVVILGALTSIPNDVYEAAAVDGATPRQELTRITIPLLFPALLPAVAMGTVWTFNMFNVVFLVSAGEPDGSTEILVTEAYRWAFTRGNQIGYAAAYAVLVFGILLLVSRAKTQLEARSV